MKKVALWLLVFLLAGGTGAVWASETGAGSKILSTLGLSLSATEAEDGPDLAEDPSDGVEPELPDPLEGEEEEDESVTEDPEGAGEEPEGTEPDNPEEDSEGEDGTGGDNGDDGQPADQGRGWRLREKVADETLPEHVRNNAQKALNNMQRAEEHHAWAQSNQGGPPPWSSAYEKHQSKPGNSKEENIDEDKGEGEQPGDTGQEN